MYVRVIIDTTVGQVAPDWQQQLMHIHRLFQAHDAASVRRIAQELAGIEGEVMPPIDSEGLLMCEHCSVSYWI